VPLFCTNEWTIDRRAFEREEWFSDSSNGEAADSRQSMQDIEPCFAELYLDRQHRDRTTLNILDFVAQR